MYNRENYVISSLELHLFFARIMKEHAIFMQAGFTPKNAGLAKEADSFKSRFETLLSRALILGNGIIRPEVQSSGELITDFTLGSEQKTQNFTGISINQNITMSEAKLHSGYGILITPDLESKVRRLNQEIKSILDNFISYKRKVLNAVLSCDIFITSYSLDIEHILREAERYRNTLAGIEQGGGNTDMRQTDAAVNRGMLEHALFIRGMLDPSENDLIRSANDYAHDYAALQQRLEQASDVMLAEVTGDILTETVQFKAFKQATTDGIARCKIRSIMLPLYADHILREASYYIRILKL